MDFHNTTSFDPQLDTPVWGAAAIGAGSIPFLLVVA
jgi:hypothetical protein